MASRKSQRAFEAAVQLHRQTIDRLLDRRALPGLKRLYDAAQAELVRKLNRAIRTGRGDTMTALQMRQLLDQVKDAQKIIAAELSAGLTPVTKEAQTEGARQSLRTVVDLEREFTGATITLPLEEAATFRGLIEGRTPSLIRAHQTSFNRYGAAVTEKIEQELALALATGETPMDAIGRVEKAADLEWWRAERIVRTELAYSYNAGHADATAAAARELDDLYNRWTEYIDDLTGRPLDNRVAPDSMALHGQVAAPGSRFTMPPDERVSAKLWGKTYAQGPNRPNDRSVTMPWRPHWGVPAWIWNGNKKVPMKLEESSVEALTARARALAGRAR